MTADVPATSDVGSAPVPRPQPPGTPSASLSSQAADAAQRLADTPAADMDATLHAGEELHQHLTAALGELRP